LVVNRSIRANDAARGHIVTLLDEFKHLGPNGEHLCLVFEPMGPDVAACFERSIPHWQRRSIVKQLLTALQRLHDLGMAHSDTNPGNLLLSLAHPIENLPGEGKSVSTRIEGERNPCAPEFIHEDRPLTEFLDRMAPAKLKLSDFGAGTY
jgi:serine/threonine protein kinase